MFVESSLLLSITIFTSFIFVILFCWFFVFNTLWKTFWQMSIDTIKIYNYVNRQKESSRHWCWWCWKYRGEDNMDIFILWLLVVLIELSIKITNSHKLLFWPLTFFGNHSKFFSYFDVYLLRAPYDTRKIILYMLFYVCCEQATNFLHLDFGRPRQCNNMWVLIARHLI